MFELPLPAAAVLPVFHDVLGDWQALTTDAADNVPPPPPR